MTLVVITSGRISQAQKGHITLFISRVQEGWSSRIERELFLLLMSGQTSWVLSWKAPNKKFWYDIIQPNDYRQVWCNPNPVEVI